MRTRLLVLVLSMLPSGAAAPAPPADISALSWLAGCWSMHRADGVTEEHWLSPAGGAMLGIGRTVKGGKLVEYEFLTLEQQRGRLAYVAKPVRQAEVVFPLVTSSETEFVFENPQHDFPQRIIYRRRGADELDVRIEATSNGKTRGVDYSFARCRP